MVYSNLLFSEGDLVGFKQEGETALRLNPNNNISLVHYGLRLAFTGEWDRGRTLIKKAITLNPLHPHWYRIPEVVYFYNYGEYLQALAELDRIEMPGFFWTHLLRAAILGQLDRLDEAGVAAQGLLKLKPAFRLEAASLIKAWHFPEPTLSKHRRGPPQGWPGNIDGGLRTGKLGMGCDTAGPASFSNGLSKQST